MVTGKPSVTVEMTADDTDLQDDLANAETAMTGLATAGTAVFAAVVAGATAAAAAVAQLVSWLNDMGDAYKVQEQAEKRLRHVVVQTGEAAGFTTEELFKMAGALQNVSNIGDEAFMPAMARMHTFTKVTGEQFERAIYLTASLSEMFGSAEGAATKLGKALNDPVKGLDSLGRMGIKFTQVERDMVTELMEANDLIGAQNVLLDSMEARYGGLAEAVRDTGTQIENSWGDVQEQIGKVWEAFKGPLEDGTLELLNTALGETADEIERMSFEAEVYGRTLAIFLEGVLKGYQAFGQELARIFPAIEKMPILGELKDALDLLDVSTESVRELVRLERQAAKMAEENATRRNEAKRKEAEETERIAKWEKDAAEAAEEATKAYLERQKTRRIQGVFDMGSEEDRAKDFMKAQDEVFKAREKLNEAMKAEDKGFVAAIEGLTDLNRRVTSAAASRTVQDKQLEVLKQQLEEAERQFKFEAEQWQKMNESLEAMSDPNWNVARFGSGT